MKDTTKWKKIIAYIRKMGYEIDSTKSYWDASTGLALIKFKIETVHKTGEKDNE